MFKFLDKLLGRKKPAVAARSAAQRPAPARRMAPPVRPKRPVRRTRHSDFLDDEIGGIELAQEKHTEEGNPYATGKWSLDKNDEARKLKAKEHGIISLEDPPEDFNPYDTGIFRGAWKD